MLEITGVFGAWAAVGPDSHAQVTHWEFRAMARGEIPFSLPPLSYALDSLEPDIDERTMTAHRERHALLVSTLNKCFGEVGQIYGQWQRKGYFVEKNGESLVKDLGSPEKLYSFPDAEKVSDVIRTKIRITARGHYNHSLFWAMMKPGGGGEPAGKLMSAIKESFSSFAAFKKRFIEIAMAHVGDGWVWLSSNAATLKIEALPNEENPLSEGRPVLLGADLCQHAYQLKYGSRRAEYLRAWFNVVNWNYVAERLARLPKA